MACLSRSEPANATACDVADGDAVESSVQRAVSELGEIELLVYSAAVVFEPTLEEMTPQDSERVIDVALLGTFNAARAVAGYAMSVDRPSQGIEEENMNTETLTLHRRRDRSGHLGTPRDRRADAVVRDQAPERNLPRRAHHRARSTDGSRRPMSGDALDPSRRDRRAAYEITLWIIPGGLDDDATD